MDQWNDEVSAEPDGLTVILDYTWEKGLKQTVLHIRGVMVHTCTQNKWMLKNKGGT